MEKKEEGVIICAQFLDFKSTRDGWFIIRFETGEDQGLAVQAVKTMLGKSLNLNITETEDT